MKRIMILGCPGSGKSTLAKCLGEKLGINVTYTDQIRFLPGWKERDKSEIAKTMLSLQAQDRWIIDGSLSAGSMDSRIQRADTFILLDFPRWLCMIRIFRRTLRHFGQPRPDMPKGCNERFNISFLKWTWNWKYTPRNRALERMEQARASSTIYHLRNRQDLAKFTHSIERSE